MRSSTKKVFLSLLCLFAFAILLFSRPYLYSTSIIPIFLFIGFIFFYMLVPGLILLFLLDIHFENRVTKYPIAFFMGMAITFAEYLLCDMFGFGGMITFVSPIITLIGILFLWIRNGGRAFCAKFVRIPKIDEIDLGFVLFIIIVFTTSLIMLRNFYSGSLYTEEMSAYPDFIWHMGNINALSQDLPPIDPRVDGVVFNYHYFSDLFYAICHRVTGISSDILVLSCAPYFTTATFGFSSYVFIKEFILHKKRAGVYCLATLLPGITLIGTIFAVTNDSVTWFHVHVLTNANAMAPAISAFMMFLVIVRSIEVQTNQTKRLLFCLSVMIFMLTGLKGPIGMAASGGTIAYFIVSLIFHRKNVKRNFFVMFYTTIFFLVAYLFVISGIQFQSKLSGASSFVFALSTGTISQSPIYAKLHSVMPGSYLFLIFLIVVNLVLIFSFFSLPALFTTGRTIRDYLRKKEDDGIETNMLMIVIVGIVSIIAYTTVFTGQGQIYFFFAAYPIVQVLAFLFLDRNDGNRKLKIGVVSVFLIGMICSMVVYVQMNYNGVQIARMESRNAIPEKPTYIQVHTKNENNSFNQDEKNAMRWLKENSDEEAIFATNIVSTEGYGRHFYYSSFSERKCFLEGWEYSTIVQDEPELTRRQVVNSELFAEENEQRAELAKLNGISYLIVKTRRSPEVDLASDKIELVYANDAMMIFKIL